MIRAGLLAAIAMQAGASPAFPLGTVAATLAGSDQNFPMYVNVVGTIQGYSFPAGTKWKYSNNVYREGPGDVGPGYDYHSGPEAELRYATLWPYNGEPWYLYAPEYFSWSTVDYSSVIAVLLGGAIDGRNGFRIYGNQAGISLDVSFTPAMP